MRVRALAPSSSFVTIMIKTMKMSGTCATSLDVDIEDGIIRDLKFYGGCDGNLKAISKLAVGMRTVDVIGLLDGIKCGRKPTSCPDQLAKALKALES